MRRPASHCAALSACCLGGVDVGDLGNKSGSHGEKEVCDGANPAIEPAQVRLTPEVHCAMPSTL